MRITNSSQEAKTVRDKEKVEYSNLVTRDGKEKEMQL
jgi:hypothetical protein